MFDFNKDSVINKVLNPLKITKNSIVEFTVGELKDTGIYRFQKIIEMRVGERSYVRYLIFSKSENTDYILEVFPGNNDSVETYLYSMTDTVPFSEEFLNDVAGQRYLTTPQGNEYERCVMPENDDRIEGIAGRIKVYDLESDQIEREVDIKIWDYRREIDGNEEYLNLEMMEDTGIFRIFTGEIIEDIFYKVYQGDK